MPGPNNSQSITSTKSLLSTQQSGQQLIDGQDILTLNQLSNSGKGGLTALAGGGLSAAPLPHHRTYGSVYGGSVR